VQRRVMSVVKVFEKYVDEKIRIVERKKRGVFAKLDPVMEKERKEVFASGDTNKIADFFQRLETKYESILNPIQF
jgi:hypothetical protein